MNGDLISRSALLQALRGNVLIDVTPYLEDAIEKQETAYNLDKVVNELEEKYTSAICPSQYHCNYPESIGCCYDMAIKEAIEIIKKGGKYETD